MGVRTSKGRWVLAAAVAGAAALGAGAASAQSRWSVGADLGTSGYGAEVAFSASPRFTIRGDVDYFTYDGEIKGTVLTYKGKLKLQTGGLFVDFHPFTNPWFVTGGAYLGTREAGATPDLKPVSNIGGTDFALGDLGVLKGKVKMADFGPFLGVGYNNTFYNTHWGFKALLGVVIAEQPTVEITRTGGPALPPALADALRAALEREAARLEDEADVLQFYPVLQVGVAYRF